MKVYVVIYLSKVWNEIGGVYTTIEEAKRELEAFNKRRTIVPLDHSQSIIERDLRDKFE